MIKATEARRKSAENKINNAIADADKLIKKAIEKGKTDINLICGGVQDEVKEAYEAAGYKVDEIQGGVKISWA